MRIGFASLVGVEPVPFPELVQWAATNSLESIEVNLGPTYAPIGDATFPGHLDPLDIVANGPNQTSETLANSGVALHALAPMINLLTANETLRNERIAYFKKTIEACEILNV